MIRKVRTETAATNQASRDSDNGRPLTSSHGLDSKKKLRMRAASNRAMRANLVPFGLGATAIYLSIIGHELSRSMSADRIRLISLALVVLGVSLAVTWGAWRRKIRSRWSHLAGGAILLTSQVHVLVDLRFPPELNETASICMLILVAGLVTMRIGWYIAVLAPSVAVWTWTAFALGSDDAWGRFGGMFVEATILSSVVMAIRLRSFWRIQTLRAGDRRRAAQLIDANCELKHEIDERAAAEQSLKQAEERYRELAARLQVLLRELDHRVKNNLAGLYSLVSMYARTDRTVSEFADAIRGKLITMKSIHEIIAEAGWRPMNLRDLISRLADQFERESGRRLNLDGPDVAIAPRQAAPMAMIVQELFANARKHGALRAPEGKVTLSWRLTDPNPNRPRLRLAWREADGPPCDSQFRAGVGHGLIRGFARFELGGTCEMRCQTPGFECEIDCVLDGVTEDAPPTEHPLAQHLITAEAPAVDSWLDREFDSRKP